MPSIVTSSKLWGNMFGTAEMRALFTDEAIVQRYLDVEAALARAQAGIGIVPAKAAAAITAVAEVGRIDWDRLLARTQVVGYPILPLVEQLSGWPEGGLGQWSHWGATTQDMPTPWRSWRRNTPKHPWRAAPTCNTPCRSRSVTRRQRGCPASIATAPGWPNCAPGSKSSRSQARLAPWPRWAATGWQPSRRWPMS
jgi:hypothetical protein